MRNRLGISCMSLGAILIAIAVYLFVINTEEDQKAGQLSEDVVLQLEQQVKEKNAESNSSNPSNKKDKSEGDALSNEASGSGITSNGLSSADQSNGTSAPLFDPSNYTMTEATVNGQVYIGYLYLPSLALKLPVMSTWSYPKLRMAPCRYSGSTNTNDLVILAHNYPRHFGHLKDLSVGDLVFFTDMDGILFQYEVMDVEVLPPNSVVEVVDGEYDLTLFTCTYGGKSRVVVRCERTDG